MSPTCTNQYTMTKMPLTSSPQILFLLLQRSVPLDKCYLCSISSYLFVISLSLFMYSIFIHSCCVSCSLSHLSLLVFGTQSIYKASSLSLSVLASILALCAYVTSFSGGLFPTSQVMLHMFHCNLPMATYIANIDEYHRWSLWRCHD